MQTEQHPDPSPAGDGAVKSPTEARQGAKLGVMRWVLGVSITLAVVGMVVAYLVA